MTLSLNLKIRLLKIIFKILDCIVFDKTSYPNKDI